MATTGARFSKLRVRTDIISASALVAVSSIGFDSPPGPLAIGIWTQYSDPRLAIPLVRPARREPGTADVALAFSPTQVGTLLVGDYQGYVVCLWSGDLVAAELAGLAVWTAALPSGHERIGPWEDPVVQRATELDLGARLPSDLALHLTWADSAGDERGIATLNALAATISSLLNIPPTQTSVAYA